METKEKRISSHTEYNQKKGGRGGKGEGWGWKGGGGDSSRLNWSLLFSRTSFTACNRLSYRDVLNCTCAFFFGGGGIQQTWRQCHIFSIFSNASCFCFIVNSFCSQGSVCLLYIYNTYVHIPLLLLVIITICITYGTIQKHYVIFLVQLISPIH